MSFVSFHLLTLYHKTFTTLFKKSIFFFFISFVPLYLLQRYMSYVFLCQNFFIWNYNSEGAVWSHFTTSWGETVYEL